MGVSGMVVSGTVVSGTVLSVGGVVTVGHVIQPVRRQSASVNAIPKRHFFITDPPYYRFSSSGMKSRVMAFSSVCSREYFTPAESIIRLEARVAMESAYLSER